MFNFKFCFIVFIVLTSVLIFNSKLYAATAVYRVLSIEPGIIIKLNNGKSYRLEGVEIDKNKEADAIQLIKSLTKNAMVIINIVSSKQESKVYSAVIYIWGNEELNLKVKDNNDLLRGYSDVKVGFWNIQKGLAVNLNKFLVEEGFAHLTK